MIHFSGYYRELKNFGFRFLKLYDNQIYYTTYEIGSESDVWIKKADGDTIYFHGLTGAMSLPVFNFLLENDFEGWQDGLTYFITGDVKKGIIFSTGTVFFIHLKLGTVETLKQLYQHGYISIS